MSSISAFDIFNIGIGPSSSHTLGPWRIVQRFARRVESEAPGVGIRRVRYELMGSLSLTGRGHATDKAICLAMLGEEPDTIDTNSIDGLLDQLAEQKAAVFAGRHVPFDPERDIVFLDEQHPGHANAIRCVAELVGGNEVRRHYFSIGGGFVASPDELDDTMGDRAEPIRPIRNGAELLAHCRDTHMRVSDVVRDNERSWWTDEEIDAKAQEIWNAMRACVRRGCRTRGELPGGLGVNRRAPAFIDEIVPEYLADEDATLIRTLREKPLPFENTLRLVSCFAIAVNEENAAMGRVVTAPTNGAAGVIPAVLMYRAAFGAEPLMPEDVTRFILVAGQIGALFKLNATISAAMGGCQAEIGVSSAMAAGALAELMNGSPERVMMAAEIAMEHHLGMTCDPVDGLVQVPCIERNAMGALKAISAAVMAMNSDPKHARVSFDDVVSAMWETAQQMNSRYKETSQGGLAVNISVRTVEC